ncbi:hypothetical protein CDD82_6850 [Ophiocordyceps australis]|uniref:Uncharacterized protein n=1 Tax=Ophiocordyceps australis TaxID=1399860 RepID=A0A2C5XFW2_9HYPO|nr:hypothetical protein CDD82_6850 [Ophiocordyceps australis]
MDDPWGDGWNADGQILALPGRAHLAASAGDTVLLASDTAAAWYACGQDQVWSPGHDSRLCKAAAPVSPGPWAALSPLDTSSQASERLPSQAKADDCEPVDTTINLGDNDDQNGFAADHVLSPQTAWEDDAPVQVEVQDSSPSESPHAVAALPFESCQPSKVLGLVDVYQDTARQLLTDLKAPHGHEAIATTKSQNATSTTLKTRPEVSVSLSAPLSHFASVFSTCLEPSSPPPPEPLPTSIPQDSFTCVAERKAWHRMSRLGSLRKHRDANGDDDSYVCVRWAGSRVREHTLDIVRRWKDEDTRGHSKSGVRGGRGAVGFNWDVVSPPVEIGKLLQQERRLRHEMRLNELAEQQIPPRPQSTQAVSTFPSSKMEDVDAPRLSPALPSITSEANGHRDSKHNDNDEEWGEMVTLPIDAAPFFEGPEQLEQTHGEPKSITTCIPPDASTIIDSIPKPGPMAQMQLEQHFVHETSASLHQNSMPPEKQASTGSTQPSAACDLADQEATSEPVLLDEAVAVIMKTLPDLSYMLR